LTSFFKGYYLSIIDLGQRTNGFQLDSYMKADWGLSVA